jgi:hypothetical protein
MVTADGPGYRLAADAAASMQVVKTELDGSIEPRMNS